LGIGEKVFGSSRLETQAEYSPDGRRIAFVSDQTGKTEIWVANADGTNPVQLTSNLSRPLRPRWSPDAKWIAFAARPNDNIDVYVIPSAGGAARRLTTHPLEDSSARFSSDGKWVYFSSTRTGRLEVFKIPFDGSAPEIQVTRQGGWTMVESPDGLWLYYHNPGFGLWRMPVNGGSETKVLDMPSTANWNLVGKRIVYQDVDRLRSYDITTGKISDITAADPKMQGYAGGLSVTPDGKWLLYTRNDQDDADVLVLDHFH
jgi:Tol biopolymer transport system component